MSRASAATTRLSLNTDSRNGRAVSGLNVVTVLVAVLVLVLLIVLVLGGFGVYATWAAFQGTHYHFGPYLSPLYSPELFTSRLIL